MYPDSQRICQSCLATHITNHEHCADCTNVVAPGEYCAKCKVQANGLMKYVSINQQACLDDCPIYQVKKIVGDIGICVHCPTEKCKTFFKIGV